jgi:hypothetical protein
MDWGERDDLTSREYRLLVRRPLLACAYCRPHRGENRTRWGGHGRTKPRYKDHRSALQRRPEPERIAWTAAAS